MPSNMQIIHLGILFYLITYNRQVFMETSPVELFFAFDVFGTRFITLLEIILIKLCQD